MDPDAPVLHGIYAPWAGSATPGRRRVLSQFEISFFGCPARANRGSQPCGREPKSDRALDLISPFSAATSCEVLRLACAKTPELADFWYQIGRLSSRFEPQRPQDCRTYLIKLRLCHFGLQIGSTSILPSACSKKVKPRIRYSRQHVRFDPPFQLPVEGRWQAFG